MMPNCLQQMDVLCLLRQDPARTGLVCAAYLEGGAIVDAARVMLKNDYHLEDISVLHAAEGFVICYFFEQTGPSGRVCLRVLAPHDAPRVPSISSVYQGADWHEREADDFYGICFEGHPNPVRLFLPSDMDIYPLRKEESGRASVWVLFPFAPEDMVMKKEGFSLFDPEPASEGGSDKTKADKTDAASSKD